MRLTRDLLFFAPAALLVSAALGCSSSSSSTSDTDAGPGADSGAEDGGGGGGACSIAVHVAGVPAGATAKITLTGPAGTKEVSADGTVALTSGDYAVAAGAITTSDPIVRTVHRATLSASTVHCDPSTAATLDVTFAPVASSNKLWMSNANGAARVLGFASASLAATATQPPTVAADTAGGGGVAFDKDGNLWAIGGTTVDPTLLRYPAASLGASGKPAPDRKIDVKNSGCSPSAHSVAFDANGNLWLTQLCDKRVVRLAPSELAQDGEVTPAIVVGGLDAPKGVAFDKAGNLWVADAKILRFDAARLAASTSDPPDATLTIANDSEDLAFDKDENLWSQGGSQINLSKLAKADLAAAGARDVTPPVTISVGVAALPQGIAFDESGGLWLATSAGKFARLAPAQLATSTTYAAPTDPERVITSDAIGSAGSVALYPAPAGLPLYSSLP